MKLYKPLIDYINILPNLALIKKKLDFKLGKYYHVINYHPLK